jgi:hypothetical protein
MEVPLYTGTPQFTQQFCFWKMHKLMRFSTNSRMGFMEDFYSITCGCDILWLFNPFVPITEPIHSHATSQSLKA